MPHEIYLLFPEHKQQLKKREKRRKQKEYFLLRLGKYVNIHSMDISNI